MIVIPVEKKIDWKRPPLVLITLVVLNVFIFAFYQFDDDERMLDAAVAYERHQLLDTEWRIFQQYLKSIGEEVEFEKTDEYTIYYIVSDAGFDRYMADRGQRYIPKSERDQWRLHRDEVEQLSSKISSKRFGFHTDNINPVQLITAQFLHGDIMHLMGNMVLLVLVGFAAEAALGSGIFLLFYLISGVVACLFYAFLASSHGVLIGASGSISGVMAMYVVLFGLRKIQFFYWVFILTGYFRAAAIIMLPIYILKEIHSYLTLDGSNVAFTAHIGGFIAGAALVGATKMMRSDAIDEQYLDNQSAPVDQTAQALQKAYDALGRCEFERAWQLLKPLKKAHPNRKEIVELEYTLVRALHPAKRKDYLIHRLDKLGNSKQIISDQLTVWSRMSPDEQSTLPPQKRNGLFDKAIEQSNHEFAEQLFNNLSHQDGADSMELAVLARRLSTLFKDHHLYNKAQEYGALAQKLAGAV